MNRNGQATDFRNQYAISTWQYVTDPLEDALEGIAAAGFRLVEIWADSAHLDPRIHPNQRSIATQLARLGLQVHSIHAPFSGLDLGRPGGPSGDALRVLSEALELGAELGARLAVVHVTSHTVDLGDPLQYEESRRVICDFMRTLDRTAAELRVELALENLPPHSDHRAFGETLQELTVNFPDPRIGFCLDIGHAALSGALIAAEIQAAGPRLRSLHVHNNDGKIDRHWPPLQGAIDWKATKAALTQIGYGGPYVLEVHGREDRDSLTRELFEFAKKDIAA